MSEGECPVCKKHLKNLEKHIERMHPPNKPTVGLVHSPHYTKYYATRALVQMTEFDLRIVFANEKIQPNKDAEAFVADSIVMLTPTAAKELSDQLNHYIENWQNLFGDIKERPNETLYTKMEMED